MTRSIVVIGAGVAGLAAAWSAQRKGARVAMVSSGAGASALGGGAVDDVPWELGVRAARLSGHAVPLRDVAPLVAEFACALGLWSLPVAASPVPLLATAAGRIRPARGFDLALLDLSSLQDCRVLLPRADRAGWDADTLARCLTQDPFARSRRVRFEPSDIPVLRYREETRISDGDLAARHDEDARASWLAERIREGILRASAEGSPVGAVLVGSWLGAALPRARAVATRAGIAVGEILTGVGSAAGLRFEAARRAFLSAAGVELIAGRVTAVTSTDSAVTIALEEDDAPLVADAVVLATGGIAGGGIVYSPPEHAAGNDLPPRGSIPFSLSLAAEVPLAVGDTPIDIVSSLHGPAIDSTAWPSPEHPGVLESVGVRSEGARAAAGIVVAGDIVAGRPRTLLVAVESGIVAGHEA